MSLHKILYWPHLICGVIAALVILSMSVTGVLLTYEKQMIRWAERDFYTSADVDQTRLSAEDLQDKARQLAAGIQLRSMEISAAPEAPVVFRLSSGDRLYLSPWTGEYLGEGPVKMRAFMGTMFTFHRWFSLEGENRATGRMITNTANLMFLFLLISGIYLWFPRRLNWQAFKQVLLFRKTRSGRARDFNWHNVFGIWTVLPLIVIVATASVFYYDWANDLVYRAAGEEPPVRSRSSEEKTVFDGKTGSLDQMLETAAAKNPDWQRITAMVPSDTEHTLRFSIDAGTGGEPTKRGTLTLDRETGAETGWQTFGDNTPGRQARIYIRFLHTGEALGFWGQTVAGLVSLITVIMIWTGLALAWRKYVQPALRKRKEVKLARQDV